MVNHILVSLSLFANIDRFDKPYHFMLTITKQMTNTNTSKTINSNKQKQWNNKVILEIYKEYDFFNQELRFWQWSYVW